MTLSIEILQADVVAAMLQDVAEKAPSAMRNTLNAVANQAQQDIQATLADRFTLRRAEFMRRTIYRKPGEDVATSTDLSAAVRVNPDRNFLAKFEDGGRKTARSGGMVAIPLPGVKRNKADIVTAANRPRGLMGVQGIRKITTPSGTWLVKEQRKRGAVGARTEFLYKFQRDVPIAPVLHFVDTATASVDRWFVSIAGDQIAAVLARMSR